MKAALLAAALLAAVPSYAAAQNYTSTGRGAFHMSGSVQSCSGNETIHRVTLNVDSNRYLLVQWGLNATNPVQMTAYYGAGTAPTTWTVIKQWPGTNSSW